jgi:2-dehydro-3-deoxyphosphogluconate aldolase / (4S)-4-hydroxy-2-oxoglutarate aldolase
MNTRIEVAQKMIHTGVVPLFFNPDPKICIDVITACYKGGARVFEFTNRGNFAWEVFAEVNKYFLKNYPDMVVGAGTIIDAPTAALYIQSGAGFIVSPILSEEVLKLCNKRKILCLPGCASLTEISKAEELGAELVKIFPGDQLGPKFISAIKGPCPWSSIMPSGGVDVDEKNIQEWISAGAACLGLGSKLITNEILETKNYAKLTEQVALACSLVEKARKNTKR